MWKIGVGIFKILLVIFRKKNKTDVIPAVEGYLKIQNILEGIYREFLLTVICTLFAC